MTYATRSQAAKHAMRSGTLAFSCKQQDDGTWKYQVEIANAPLKTALKFAAGKDYINHVEMDGMNPIFIVTCLREELASEKLIFEIEPLTPSMWDAHTNSISHVYGKKPPRMGLDGTVKEASTVASPSKLVWEIAGANPTAARKEVIALCVAQGVHMATASTQYYRWKQAQPK